MDQLALFDVPPSEPAGKSKARFLTANAAIMRCLLASETLANCATTAAASVSKAHGDDRNTGGKFEDRLKDLILDPETSARISSEVLAAAAATNPELSLVKAELVDGPGAKALADLVLVVRADRARTVRIAVNVKRLAPSVRKTEGGSILQFLQLATEPDYDPLDPPTPNGFDYEQAVLEMLTRRRRIQDGRDFWLLVARVDKGTLLGLEAWGTMVGTSRSSSIVTRHPNRAVLAVRQPDGTIGDVDPNLTIAEQLLPKASASALRAQLVSAVYAADGKTKAAAAAERLLALDDDGLLSAVRAALEV